MGYMYLGLQLFGTSEEVVIKLRLLGRLEPFSRGCDRMRASFDEVSSRRLYNIASLGGTADQLKMKFRTCFFTNHYTCSLPEIRVHYDYDGETPKSQPLFVFYRS